MKPLLIGGLLTALLAGLTWQASNKKGTATMTSSTVAGQLQHLLETDSGMKLSKLDCKPYYETDYGGQRLCYGSSVVADELVTIIDKKVNEIAFTPGWRDDYGIPGAFYEMKDRSKRTFGITISPIEGDRELEGKPALKPFKVFVTVSINPP